MVTLLLTVALVGAYVWVADGRRFQTVYHLLRTDSGPIRDLDGSRGPVGLRGRAVVGDDDTVTAPFTGTECLACTYEAEERLKGVNGHSWTTLDEGMSGVDFVVEDDTGRVAVDAAGANLQFEDHTTTILPDDDDLPERVADYVAGSSDIDRRNRTVDLSIAQLHTGNRLRFTEQRLDVGEQVYVHGQARAGPSVERGSNLIDTIVGDGEAIPAFVISDTNKRGTAWRLAQPGLRRFLMAVSTIGVGGVLVALFLA